MKRYAIVRAHGHRLECLGVIEVQEPHGAVEAQRRLDARRVRAGVIPWSELTVRQRVTAMKGLLIDHEGRDVQGELGL